MSHMFQDLKSGLRVLRKNPGTAVLGLLVLAVGIGTNAAMFSIVNGIVMKGLPFEDGDRILHVDASRPSKGYYRQRVTVHEYLDFREQQSSFAELHAFRFKNPFVSGFGKPVGVGGAQITPGAFDVLGISPVMGRAFEAEDALPGAAKVAIVGHRFWRQTLGGDPGVLGKVLRLDGHATTVIGVMPEGFRFPANEEIWMPLVTDRSLLSRAEAPNRLHVFGRLKDGQSLESARADLGLVSRRMAETYPATDEGLGVLVEPYGQFFVGEDKVVIAWVCLGAVGFVLLIACANVANLLLARASERSREMALRLALGAGPRRIVSQVLAESLVLASFAAALGVGLALGLIRMFNRAVADQDWPFWFDVRIDGRTLLFLVVVTVLSAVAVGLAPALSSFRLDLSSILGDRTLGSQRGGRMTAALVVSEVALSCVLLVGAGLMVRTILNYADVDFSFDTEDVVSARVALLTPIYPEKEDLEGFWRQAMDELGALPGVEAVGYGDFLPVLDEPSRFYYAADHTTYERMEDQPVTSMVRVSPGWLDALQIQAMHGRVIRESDRADSEPVVVVTESFARKQWGDRDPVGNWVRIGAQEVTEDPWRRVVGVVPDVYTAGFDKTAPLVLVPAAQSGLRDGVLVARTSTRPAAVGKRIEDAVYGFAPDTPVFHTAPYADAIADKTFFFRLVATLFLIMAGVALVLVSTGLYGILAYFVSRRTAEAGLRMALGANKPRLALWIAGRGFRYVIGGLALGLVLSFFLARLLENQLFRVSAGDPVTFLLVVGSLITVAAASAVVPAWRATGVSPTVALRSE